jgi:type IV pilus assembly protein PilE
MQKQLGLTLIELLTAVAIIGILSGLAIPAYDRYTRSTTRSAAKTTLERVRGLVESYRVNNKSYTSDLTKLGFSNSPLNVDKTGEEAAPGSSDVVYQIAITTPGTVCTACQYELTATAMNGQANDTDCGNLTLNSLGQKSASGSKGIKCW